MRICQNQECNKEIIARRSDSKTCSSYCQKRKKFLDRKEYYKEYQKNYRKEKFEERREFNLKRGKIYYQKNKEAIAKKRKLYNEQNKEKVKARRKKYKEKNRDKILAQAKEYREKNKDRINKYISEWQKANRDKCRAKDAKRRARELQAIPKFANLNKIKEIYKNCPIGYEVDHIIPLQGKIVSGLHIETNLQYLPIKENRSKGNKLL
tara:strand:+ start:94 stop:717 length:624 start_codon:yes stop_codon:yes gene_type:complete